MGSLKEDLIQAMKTSSLKGLPKIVAAPNKFHRVLWIISVMILFGICVWTVSNNINTFLGYPKVMTVEEKLIDQIDPNGTVPFPTIAVCNLNAFGSNDSVFKAYGIPRPEEYYEWVYNATECDTCSGAEKYILDVGKRKLLTTRGYYQYVGKDAMYKVGNQHFVLKCQVIVASASNLLLYPCESYVREFNFVMPDVGPCYAYEIILSPDRWIVGLTFTLHLDSSDDNVNKKYEPLLYPQPQSGALIYAMDPHLTPHTWAASTSASPGVSTTIYLKSQRTDRLGFPYSDRDCIHGDGAKVSYTFQNRTTNYDPTSCFGKCAIAYCQTHCNCTDLFMATNPEDGDSGYKYCISRDQSAQQLYENMMCSESTKFAGFSHCSPKCMEPCREIKYTMSTSTSKWPLPSQISSFYENFIVSDDILMQKYGSYMSTARSMGRQPGSVSGQSKMLLSRVIEDNFALVSVYISGSYYTHYESTPKITIDAFISQLGGSLNLWSGITVVLCVEFIDLIITVLSRLTQDGAGSGSGATVTSGSTKVHKIKVASVSEKELYPSIVNEPREMYTQAFKGWT